MQGVSLVDLDFSSDVEEIAVRSIDTSSTVGDSILILRSIYAESHFTYHLGHTVADTFDAPFVRTTYPDSWVSRYLLQSYVNVDPIVQQGLNRRLPFDWRDMSLNAATEAFFADAKAHGVGRSGYSIPVTDRVRRRALLSINSNKHGEDWSRFVARHRDEWILIAQVLHQQAVMEVFGDADPVPSLSSRELECLHWTALGKSSKDIALILQISEHTIRDYLKSAKLRLGCATLSAATTKATHLKIINPWSASTPQNEGSF